MMLYENLMISQYLRSQTVQKQSFGGKKQRLKCLFHIRSCSVYCNSAIYFVFALTILGILWYNKIAELYIMQNMLHPAQFLRKGADPAQV